MERSVTPLPPTLSGNIIERLIRIDEALVAYINGALVWLCDYEPFEETGALTVEQAKLLFSDMLQTYFNEQPTVMPVGAVIMHAANVIPDKWLICDGAAISRATYADLFAIIGIDYGAGNGTTTFNIPDWRGYSPMGAAGTFGLGVGAVIGEYEHTLTVGEMPTHNHGVNDPGHSHRIGKSSGTVDVAAARPAANARTDNTATPDMMTDSATTGIGTENTGDGLPHMNIHPVMGTTFLIYTGVL